MVWLSDRVEELEKRMDKMEGFWFWLVVVLRVLPIACFGGALLIVAWGAC